MKHCYNEQKVKNPYQNRNRNQVPISLDFSFLTLFALCGISPEKHFILNM